MTPTYGTLSLKMTSQRSTSVAYLRSSAQYGSIAIHIQFSSLQIYKSEQTFTACSPIIQLQNRPATVHLPLSGSRIAFCASILILALSLFASTMTRRSNKISAAFADDATTTITKDASSIPLPATFKDGLPLPKMMVFDLDYTLWPLWCDTHITAPIKRSPDGLTVKDRYGESYGFYNDVAGILTAIKSHNIILGAASRTCAPEMAREMLSMFAVPGSGAKNALSLFDYLEIYPGSKTTHFAKLQKKSGEVYEEMLFFDDESRNRNVETLGVTMRLVRDGVTRAEIDQGVVEWRKRNGRNMKEESE